MLLVPGEAEPREVLPDALGIRLARPFLVGVVEPEDEAPLMLPRPQPIVDGSADVADVEPPGRRRGETGDDAHRGAVGRGAGSGNGLPYHSRPLWSRATRSRRLSHEA